jgi:hypothetical protein
VVELVAIIIALRPRRSKITCSIFALMLLPKLSWEVEGEGASAGCDASNGVSLRES